MVFVVFLSVVHISPCFFHNVWQCLPTLANKRIRITSIIHITDILCLRALSILELSYKYISQNNVASLNKAGLRLSSKRSSLSKGPFIATQLNSIRRRVVDTFTA